MTMRAVAVAVANGTSVVTDQIAAAITPLEL
jgi:hypothetical protein